MDSVRGGLLAELKRRKVFRVAVVYAVVAWVLAQAADILLGNFGAPAWVFQSFVIVLALGFPVALLLAWALELTPDGIQRDGADTGRNPALAGVSVSRRRIVVALVTILGMGLGTGWLVMAPGPLSTVTPPAAGSAHVSTEAAQSIAVLAFADLSPEGDQEYFSDGIAEEILNALVRVEGLKVAGRTSSFHFKGRNEDLRAIGATLGVAHILEGSVRKQGERVRITAQLIRSDDGFHLWSETYDGDLSDVFELQERIARAITTELEVVLRGDQQEQLVPISTRDAEAYALYLEATAIFNRRDGQRFPEAVSKLERALALDPGFARAHARLAAVHVVAPAYTEVLPDAAHAAAEEHARLALEIDPAMAEPQAVLANALQSERRFSEAQTVFERALALNPNDVTTTFWFATHLWSTGYLAQGADLLDRVLAIDPLLPNALVWRAAAYHNEGDLESGERLALRAKEVGIAHVGHIMSGFLVARGREAEAIRGLGEGLDAMMAGDRGDLTMVLARGMIEGGEARETALRRIDDYLASEPPVLSGVVAHALERLGGADRALRLVQDRPTDNDAIFFSSLWGREGGPRRSPAFPEFVRRTGLADLWERKGPPDLCRRLGPRDYDCK